MCLALKQIQVSNLHDFIITHFVRRDGSGSACHVRPRPRLRSRQCAGTPRVVGASPAPTPGTGDGGPDGGMVGGGGAVRASSGGAAPAPPGGGGGWVAPASCMGSAYQLHL